MLTALRGNKQHLPSAFPSNLCYLHDKVDSLMGLTSQIYSPYMAVIKRIQLCKEVEEAGTF